MKIITFDIGGTKIARAVVEISGTGKFKLLDCNKDNNPKDARQIKAMLLDFSSWSKSKYGTDKVAISSARLVNDEKKVVSGAGKYYGKDKFSFKFMEAAGYGIRMDNDGSCFALGEYFQLEKKPKVLLGVAFGTGIGAGLVVDGRSYKGSHFTSMEVGHMIIEKDGEKCFCGQKGCWEIYAGGRGIEKHYQKISGKGKREMGVLYLAKQGDGLARQTLERSKNYSVSGMINLLNIFDPQLVVFGGGISKHKFYMDDIIKELKKSNFNNKGQAGYYYKISQLGHGSNLLGAASLWL